MLNRQRALLAILGEFKEAIAPIPLVKLAFLASIESDLQSDRTFYEFVPYHYGPFSFALYRELDPARLRIRHREPQLRRARRPTSS